MVIFELGPKEVQTEADASEDADQVCLHYHIAHNVVLNFYEGLSNSDLDSCD